MKILLTKQNIKRFLLFSVILLVFAKSFVEIVHVDNILKFFKIDVYEQLARAFLVYLGYIGCLVVLTVLAQVIACKLVPFEEDSQ